MTSALRDWIVFARRSGLSDEAVHVIVGCALTARSLVDVVSAAEILEGISDLVTADVLTIARLMLYPHRDWELARRHLVRRRQLEVGPLRRLWLNIAKPIPAADRYPAALPPL